jgi:hypothetical protein
LENFSSKRDQREVEIALMICGIGKKDVSCWWGDDVRAHRRHKNGGGRVFDLFMKGERDVSHL